MLEHARGRNYALTVVCRVSMSVKDVPDEISSTQPTSCLWTYVPGLSRGKVKLQRALVIRSNADAVQLASSDPVEVVVPAIRKTKVLRCIIDRRFVAPEKWPKLLQGVVKHVQLWAASALSIDVRSHIVSVFRIFKDEATKGRRESSRPYPMHR